MTLPRLYPVRKVWTVRENVLRIKGNKQIRKFIKIPTILILDVFFAFFIDTPEYLSKKTYDLRKFSSDVESLDNKGQFPEKKGTLLTKKERYKNTHNMRPCCGIFIKI